MIEKTFRYIAYRTSYFRHAVRCTLYDVLVFSLWSLVVSLALTGCLKSTYPENYVKESVLKILRAEYNIPLAQVAITGKTIHLYLPVERLFTVDLDDVKVVYVRPFGYSVKNKFIVWTARIISAPQDVYWELLAKMYRAEFLRQFKMNWIHTKIEKKRIDKIQDAIMLLELHPEVQDEIGQMLFAVARVARSTDLKLDFYSAQVTDVRSGQEFILQGYLPDMNRLQLLDISMAEYHKRMLKDNHVNNRAQVHYPVRSFFFDLNQKTRMDVREKYFSKLTSEDWMDRFSFRNKTGKLFPVSQMTWEIKDVRSFLSPAGGRALVYVKTEKLPRDVTNTKVSAPEEEEFLFEMLVRGKRVQILRIIPFNLLSEMLTSMPEFKMNKETLQENIKTWRSEFEPREIFIEDFLARQMMMRLYEEVSGDERISNTFTDLHFEVQFRRESREFVFKTHPALKDPKSGSSKSIFEHEDMIYLEDKFTNRAATIFHNYGFKDFKSLVVEFPTENERFSASPEDLELYYKKKKDLRRTFQSDHQPIQADSRISQEN